MRVADFVIQFLEQQGIDHCFTVCGGGSIFLNDALAKAKKMKYVACHHEQAAAMAAEGYARVRNGLGLCMVTSGPGGTNAITGCAGAWTDHVPVVFISGQVFSTQTVGTSHLRTKGVQEINIVPMAEHITKYAAQVREPATIRQHLNNALAWARHGRPGPVWLDIPADVQNAKVDPAKLDAEPHTPWLPPDQPETVVRLWAEEIAGLLLEAQFPLIHVGQGVRLAGAEAAFMELLESIGIPVVTARNANDIIDSGHPQYVGRPGTFAQRGANFAVQTCDLYLAIGTRLSLAQTGYNAKDYARRAKVVMVDIDWDELNKNTVLVDKKICADAKVFIEALLRQLRGRRMPDRSAWLARCKAWQAKYPPVTGAQRKQAEYVNSYHLIDELSKQATPDDVIVTDMGFAFQNTHQAWHVKKGQRLFTNCGLAAMGYGLPHAVGAAIGSGKRVIAIVGDGGFMFSSQELSTIRHHNLPVKIFLLNNGGYLTMRQSQAHAFDGYMGSDEKSGLSFPDFKKLAQAHWITHVLLEESGAVAEAVEDALLSGGPWLTEVMMDPNQPQVPKSINRREPDGTIKQTAIEDAWPYLPREELEENLKV